MRGRLPFLGTALLFLVVQLAALALAPIFPTEYQAFEDAQDPANPLIYMVLILLVTGGVLLLIRLGKQRVIQALFLFSVLVTLFFVSLPLIYLAFPMALAALVGAIAVAAFLVGLLLLWPEWYVIDLVGVMVGMGVTAILGMSLGILPALILLIILAVYDAISVYKTKHMLTLADSVTPLKLPVLFVVPKRKGFSMKSLENKRITQEGEEREALFMGLGDAVIPGVLVVSSFVFLPSASWIQGANLMVALGTLVGGFAGYLFLMREVAKGKPHAGLPFLNGGAVSGYLISYLLVFQDLGFGIL
ncbi:MAG: presenilin family intramembrane aspartyl protease PSH [Methanomassiliicoccales archaeon]